MDGQYNQGYASCQKEEADVKKRLRSLGTHHVAQRQLQPTEFRMVVHAERVGNVQAVAGQQLQPVAGFLQAPAYCFKSAVVAPTRLCGVCRLCCRGLSAPPPHAPPPPPPTSPPRP